MKSVWYYECSTEEFIKRLKAKKPKGIEVYAARPIEGVSEIRWPFFHPDDPRREDEIDAVVIDDPRTVVIAGGLSTVCPRIPIVAGTFRNARNVFIRDVTILEERQHGAWKLAHIYPHYCQCEALGFHPDFDNDEIDDLDEVL